jgi:surfactin synthase thioesterase subunit
MSNLINTPVKTPLTTPLNHSLKNPAERPEPPLDGDTQWIRRYHHASIALALTLVCFPHAGGSASFYHPLSAALARNATATTSVEVLAVQYPGRQDRRSEPVIRSIETLADQAYEALRGWTGRTIALFGHSMGATVAFEVARRMEAEGAGAGPRFLIASARRAPAMRTDSHIHRKDDAGIVRELQRLSGTAKALLDDPEILAAMIPPIRGDYAAIESYRSAPDAAIDAPVHIFAALDDPLTSLPQAEAWAAHTRGGSSLTTFRGGHFYLENWRPEVVDAVAARVREA